MPGPISATGLSAITSTILPLHENATRTEIPASCHGGITDLCGLVFGLETAFADECMRGATLGRNQDTASFKRLDENISMLLKTYSQGNCSDWRRYAVWSEHGYVRHLLWSTDEFELMVLCWKPGQASRIHNHADSHCWVTVLEGEIRETQYRPAPTEVEVPARVQSGVEGATGPNGIRLEPTVVTDLRAGGLTYINDNIALHSVACPPAPCRGAAGEDSDGAGAGACTLHLYSPPIRRVKAFEDGKVVECVPGFFSRHSVCGASRGAKD